MNASRLPLLLASVAALAVSACAGTVRDSADRRAATSMTPMADPPMTASGPSPSASPPDAIATMALMKTPTPPKADADMQAVLDALTALRAPPIGSVSPAQQRTAPTPADAVKRVMAAQGRPTAPEPGVTTRDVTYPGAGGQMIKARVYTPAGATGPLPVILYFHGGGWVIANPDVYDATPRSLAKQVQAIVVSASYRQAPEAKFPAAHDDANAAYAWVLANAASWGGDPRRVAVAGESAGGNLAANVAIHARDRGLQAPLHQLLVYPVAGTDVNTPSYLRNAAAMPLGKAGMLWFMHYVTRSSADAQDPRLNLVAAKLQGLPPATLIAAEIDPLASEGEQLAERLRAAGTPVERRLYDGATHEFFGMAAVVRDAYDAQAFAAERLRAAFAAAPK